MSIIFHLQPNSGGFFCQVLKLTANYLFAKKHNLELVLDDSNWLFKHKIGWRDYFTSLISLTEKGNISQPIYPEVDVDDARLHQFTLKEYIEGCHVIFQLQDSVFARYQTQRSTLPAIYNAIMIRRGDKMYGEAKYIPTKEYVRKLLEKSHADIFVQTDDYTAYEEVCALVKEYQSNHPDIQVRTTCPNTKRGAFVFHYMPSIGSPLSELNNQYLLKLSEIQQKPIKEYTPDEMKDHVEEMLIGLMLCTQSEYLVTDFQSNSTRFLLCAHRDPSHVLPVGEVPYPPFDVPMECLAKGFIST